MLTFLKQWRFQRLFMAIIILAFVARLYKITNPVADWHSFRQADTASVTREYVKHGIDFLHPKYHDLSNIQSGDNVEWRDNVEGWRMVEFPLINGLLAYLLRLFPQLDLVLVSRLASVIASLFSLVFLVLVIRRVYGAKIALLTGFFFAVLPYSVYYSRVILPEPFFIAFSLGSLWGYLQFLFEENKRWLVLSVVLFTLALLVKPMSVFFIPVFLGLRLWKSFDLKGKDILAASIYLLSFIPLLLWRQWIQQYKIGIPVSNWLYNGVGRSTNLSAVYMIRFKPAWWRWIFYERLTKLFLGFFGVIPFAGAFIAMATEGIKKRRQHLVFLLSWVAGAFLYVSVFAAGNVQHDYYQAPLVPFVCLALSLGTMFIFKLAAKFTSKLIALSVCLLLTGLTLFFAFQQVKGYYNINNPDIILAGKAADRLLPKDAKVIAPYGGDTAFLFQTNRTGWPIGFGIDTKIAEGARYYVSVNYDDETNALMKKYTVVEAKKEYVIIDLTKKAK